MASKTQRDTFYNNVVSEDGFGVGTPASYTQVINSSGNITGDVTGTLNGASIVKVAETAAFGDFTNGGAAVGTFEFSTDIPIGATFLYAAVTAVTGFAGDVSAVLTIGDGSDVDRYNTGTLNVFATAANGVAAGDPSGTRYHTAAKTRTLTITVDADWDSVTAGSVTVELFYLT